MAPAAAPATTSHGVWPSSQFTRATSRASAPAATKMVPLLWREKKTIVGERASTKEAARAPPRPRRWRSP